MEVTSEQTALSLIDTLANVDDITNMIMDPIADALQETALASSNHPQVQVVYNGSMIYNLNLVMSITYAALMPILWFAFFDAGENLTIPNIAWIVAMGYLVVYSALMIVGSEDIQKSMLASVFYTKGLIQALMLMHSVALIGTILYWISTIEDRYSVFREDLGQSAFDILTW